jgi:hypothetical protein
MKPWIPLLSISLFFGLGNSLIAKEKENNGSKAESRELKEETKEEKREEREKKKEEKKEAREKNAEERETRVNGRALEREAHQQRRIEDGIMRGNLTPTEVNNLKANQDSVDQLRKSLTADGKMTTEEAGKLKDRLNACSLAIFAEKHDAEGKAKGVFGFGHSIALSKEVSDRLSGANINRKDAQIFLKDLHDMTYSKWRLSEENLTPVERMKIQEQYNQLINRYFVPVAN